MANNPSLHFGCSTYTPISALVFNTLSLCRTWTHLDVSQQSCKHSQRARVEDHPINKATTTFNVGEDHVSPLVGRCFRCWCWCDWTRVVTSQSANAPRVSRSLSQVHLSIHSFGPRVFPSFSTTFNRGEVKDKGWRVSGRLYRPSTERELHTFPDGSNK